MAKSPEQFNLSGEGRENLEILSGERKEETEWKYFEKEKLPYEEILEIARKTKQEAEKENIPLDRHFIKISWDNKRSGKCLNDLAEEIYTRESPDLLNKIKKAEDLFLQQPFVKNLKPSYFEADSLFGLSLPLKMIETGDIEEDQLKKYFKKFLIGKNVLHVGPAGQIIPWLKEFGAKYVVVEKNVKNNPYGNLTDLYKKYNVDYIDLADGIEQASERLSSGDRFDFIIAHRVWNESGDLGSSKGFDMFVDYATLLKKGGIVCSNISNEMWARYNHFVKYYRDYIEDDEESSPFWKSLENEGDDKGYLIPIGGKFLIKV